MQKTRCFAAHSFKIFVKNEESRTKEPNKLPQTTHGVYCILYSLPNTIAKMKRNEMFAQKPHTVSYSMNNDTHRYYHVLSRTSPFTTVKQFIGIFN